MKLVIEYQGVKRVISGPFNVCLDRETAESIARCLTEFFADHPEISDGWLPITDLPNEAATGAPISWKAEG